mgnify:CR=1 FL=1|jgi:glucose uptake protein GlcU
METLILFLLGFTVACAGAIGVFFLKFWKHTQDRLFLVFALAFILMGVGWVVHAFTMRPHDVAPGDESHFLVYVPRLLAFSCIIWAIWDKNRTTRPVPHTQSPASGQA